jgi:hypothetical protein
MSITRDRTRCAAGGAGFNESEAVVQIESGFDTLFCAHSEQWMRGGAELTDSLIAA